MRRSVATVVGALTGTVLLVGAKMWVHPTADAAAATAAMPMPSATDSQQDPATASPTATPGRSPGRTAKPKASTSTRTAGFRDGTYNGKPTTERWGTIAVAITVTGGKIVKSTGTCPGCGGMSQSISSGAFPTLQQEALSAQSSRIATVSGATYTSGAYRTSLQSALDAAKA